MKWRIYGMRFPVLALALLMSACGMAQDHGGSHNEPLRMPDDIQAVLRKPLYENAVWSLRVVDLDSNKVLIDSRSHEQFFIGSLRKVFSIGELLNEVGPNHRYNTPVYRNGAVDSKGVLHGDLILVASGDLTMGGRTNSDGSIAVTDIDHNEANSLGNAILSKPDPVAGYIDLARQIAARGLKRITGDVIIDDRLFQPFNFRGEFQVTPIFVNDDVVDLSIEPAAVGHLASVRVRPESAALHVDNNLKMGPSNSENTVSVNPFLPQCIGSPDCTAEITRELPVDFIPPLTSKYPLIRIFRIVKPSNYARTVVIEALKFAGVTVDAPLTADNPVKLLPSKDSYLPDDKVAELEGQPYASDAKFILKVSYNIGADTSLVLFGLTQGVDNMQQALEVERRNLGAKYDIPEYDYHFVDGSGGGPSTANGEAVTQMLTKLAGRSTFPQFIEALPSLAVDGSLAFVTDFESDSTLAGAKGKVHAKPGTYVLGSGSGFLLKGQAFGGYIDTKNGNHLAYEVIVNNVKVNGLNDVLQVFQDEGAISAILWRDN